MIGALVQFPGYGTETEEELAARWAASAPHFEAQPGFIQKSFLFKEEPRTFGGFYLWETLEAAQAYYSDDWRAYMKERIGAEPSVTYFKVPAMAGAPTRLPTPTA